MIWSLLVFVLTVVITLKSQRDRAGDSARNIAVEFQAAGGARGIVFEYGVAFKDDRRIDQFGSGAVHRTVFQNLSIVGQHQRVGARCGGADQETVGPTGIEGDVQNIPIADVEVDGAGISINCRVVEPRRVAVGCPVEGSRQRAPVARLGPIGIGVAVEPGSRDGRRIAVKRKRGGRRRQHQPRLCGPRITAP